MHEGFHRGGAGEEDGVGTTLAEVTGHGVGGKGGTPDDFKNAIATENTRLGPFVKELTAKK